MDDKSQFFTSMNCIFLVEDLHFFLSITWIFWPKTGAFWSNILCLCRWLALFWMRFAFVGLWNEFVFLVDGLHFSWTMTLISLGRWIVFFWLMTWIFWPITCDFWSNLFCFCRCLALFWMKVWFDLLFCYVTCIAIRWLTCLWPMTCSFWMMTCSFIHLTLPC